MADLSTINLSNWDAYSIAHLVPDRVVRRDGLDALIPALADEEITVVIGPRQSGKTTLLGMLVHHLIQKGTDVRSIHFANMDDVGLHAYLEDPDRVIRFIRDWRGDDRERAYLFLDEIQRLEEAGLLLKRLYDRSRNLKIIASGSSVIDLRSKVQESLTGRKFEYILYPFSFREFVRAKGRLPDSLLAADDVSWEELRSIQADYGKTLESLWGEFVRFGGYPKVALAEETARKVRMLSELYTSYVQRDIMGFVRNGNSRPFLQFMELMAAEVGTVLNKHSLSRTLGRNIRTVDRYIDLTGHTFVIHLWPPFVGNKRVEIRSAPKLAFVDSGLRNYITGDVELDRPWMRQGGLIESLVSSEVRKYAGGATLYHWRTRAGAEVDVVIKRGKQIIPVEVKSALRGRTPLTKGYGSFIEAYRPEMGMYLTMNQLDRRRIGRTMVYWYPIPLFLLFLPSILPQHRLSNF